MTVKILHYIPTYAPAWSFGGPVASVSRLCEGLAQLGHDVEVFTSNAGLAGHSEFSTGEPVKRNGVRVTYFAQVPGAGIACPGMEAAVRSRISEFDIVHVTGVWQRTSFAACDSARRASVPYVISPRGALGPYSWGRGTLKKVLYYLWRESANVKFASAIHYTSKQELEECRLLANQAVGFVSPNSIDLEQWQPQPEVAAAWRTANGYGQDDFLILSAGRLHHKKGLDLLPQALASMQGSWKMLFVGNDDDGTKCALQKAFEALGIADRVKFIQAVEPGELPAIFGAADVFVLPSRHENFGNVVLEALACGCPVIVSDQVGLHQEVLAAGVGIVAARNPSSWTAGLEQVRAMRECRLENSLKASEWARANFDSKSVAQAMEHKYRQLLMRSGGLI